MSAYVDAVQAFEQCVERLRELRGGDFVRTYQQSETLREQCEATRKALEQHVSEHRCGAPETASGMHAILV